MAHDVFVSYSHQNRAAADAVVHVLEAAGVRCWYAPRDIVPGADWGTAIVQAIHGSRVMVLLLSQPTFASPQVPREVERAINKGVPVVPVRLEDVALEGAFEYYLSTAHWLDAFTPSLDAHLDTLRASVLTLLALRPRAADTADRPVADHSAPDRQEAAPAGPTPPAAPGPMPDRLQDRARGSTPGRAGGPGPRDVEVTPSARISTSPGGALDARPRRPCPVCAELVLADAHRCRYCSADLHAPRGAESVTAAPPTTASPPAVPRLDDRRAAEQGYARAQSQLGSVYPQGALSAQDGDADAVPSANGAVRALAAARPDASGDDDGPGAAARAKPAEVVQAILRTYVPRLSGKLSVAPSIPPDTVKRARERSDPPAGEEVSGVIDATWFGVPMGHLLFTDRALYWHNPRTATEPGPGRITYRELVGREPVLSHAPIARHTSWGAPEITLDAARIIWTGRLPREILKELLTELASAVQAGTLP